MNGRVRCGEPLLVTDRIIRTTIKIGTILNCDRTQDLVDTHSNDPIQQIRRNKSGRKLPSEESAKIAHKLLSMLQDSDSSVRESAVQTMGKLSLEDLKNLWPLLNDSSGTSGTDELHSGVLDSLKRVCRNAMKTSTNKNQTAFRQAIRPVSSIYTTPGLGMLRAFCWQALRATYNGSSALYSLLNRWCTTCWTTEPA